MGDVEFSECAAWVRGGKSNPRNILLNMALPGQVGFAVARKEPASQGDVNKLNRIEKGKDQVDEFGRKTREVAAF